MIVSYIDKYFDFLKDSIDDFNVDYLKMTTPFLKNFVYLSDGSPIALISYALIYDRIELEYIWVNENYRRIGVASKLMNKMFEENVNNITLEVRIDNYSAVNLYKKFGFQIVSVREKYYGSEDAYLMIRKMM